MRTGYRAGQTAVDVETPDAGAHAWLTEFLEPWTERAPGGYGGTLVRLLWRDGACENRLRPPAGHAVRLVPCFALDSRVVHLPGWEDEGCTVIADDEIGCHYRISGRAVDVVARPEHRRARLGLMRVVREILAAGSLEAGSLLDLHAAAFAVGGRAALIVGGKNSGKTTLLTHALASGRAEFVANDRVFVDVGRSPAGVIGVPTIVSVREWTIAAFPALRPDGRPQSPSLRAGEDAQPDGKGAEAGRPGSTGGAAFSPDQFARRMSARRARGGQAAALIFPVIDPHADAWEAEPLPPAAAEPLLRGALYGASVSPRPATILAPPGQAGRRAGQRETMARRLSDCVPCVRMRLGPRAYAASAEGWMRALGLDSPAEGFA